MNPFFMFLLAILSPPLMALILLVPPYAGIVAASYLIYYKSGAVHPLADRLSDVFYMIDVYMKLLLQWSHHMMEMDVLHYSVPLLLLPILGITTALWLASKVSSKLKDIFQLGVSH
jgi:hypothetical protein